MKSKSNTCRQRTKCESRVPPVSAHRVLLVACPPVLFLLCSFSFVSSASAGPKEEFTVLERLMIAAQDDYIEALEALDTAEPSQQNKNTPKDPRAAILKKMDALVTSSMGQSDSAHIMIETYLWSLDIEPDKVTDRFAKLVAAHPDHENLNDVLGSVVVIARESGARQSWIEALEKLADATKKKQTKSGAYLAAGQLLLDQEKTKEAKSRFEKVIKAEPDSEWARAARGFLNEIEHLQIGMTAPSFTARTIDGRDVSLGSLQGKIVLLNFWATWCPSCIGEIATLEAAFKKFSGRPFEILSVSLDVEKESLNSVLVSFKIPGTHTWEPKGKDNPIAEMYNVQRLPTWYLLDQKGIIRKRDPIGEALSPSIESLLKHVVSDPPKPIVP